MSLRNTIIGILALIGSALVSRPALASCVDPPGDVNGNGVTNVTDVQCAILAALASLKGESNVPCAAGGTPTDADLDCDCATVVSDVVLCIIYALSGPLDVGIDGDQDLCHNACELAGPCTCAADGTPCDAPGPCSTSGACVGGACTPQGADLDFNPCNDLTACTQSDVCGAGLCVGVPYVCAAGGAVCDGVGGCASCDPLLAEPNRLVNGDAEAGPASITGAEVVAVPGWSTISTFTVLPWQLGPGWLGAADLAPADAGLSYFAGGPGGELAIATQTVDVSADAALIDAGDSMYAVSGYLGGLGTQADAATVVTKFIHADGTAISQIEIGPVTPAQRSFASGLVLRSQCGKVPPGTRAVEVQILLQRDEGDYNDGYADNVRLVLAPIPEGVCFADADCNDGIACTADVCGDGNTCQFMPADDACDDGVPCTGDTCDPTFGCQFAVPCDDGDPCTENSCDPATGGCVFTASGAPCDDANPCTLGDVCRSPETVVVSGSPASSSIFCKSFDFFPPACYVMTYTNTSNLALASPGGAKPAVTKTVYAGGTASIHQPQWLNDGAYGNGTSWIAEGPDNWAKIDLGMVHVIDRVRFGRDRTGWYNDRDPGRVRVLVAHADAVYANGDDAEDAAEYNEVFDSLDAGYSGQVSFGETIEARFAPAKGRFVKVIFDADGAAIDEIEVLAAEGGSCVPVSSLCDDGDPCTADSCDAGSCSYADATQDLDDDGYFGCVDDCDDTDPAVNPGAQELCNGKDDNCDGALSPEIDGDGDGFAPCQGDCADGDPTVYPGAPEGCDGKDTDCTGGLGQAEVDWDADGYTQCQGDCGPYDERAHPGATAYYTTPIFNPGGFSWDFDCNGVAEPALTLIGETCIGAFVCVSGKEGWDSFIPACGSDNYYYGSCNSDNSGLFPTYLCKSTYELTLQACK